MQVIDSKSFYTCKNLYAVIVDEANENDVSVDGVLYATENGEPAELVLYPIDNGDYRTALAMGIAAPADAEGAAAFIEAIDAMKAGKAVAMEVGGAYTVDECFDLVRTYEETKAPFMFLENCCYDRNEMAVFNMVRKGLLGEIIHL